MGWQSQGFYLGDYAGRIFDRNGNGGPTACARRVRRACLDGAERRSLGKMR
jgi:hypothetical protein